jgi:hypothetical protein
MADDTDGSFVLIRRPAVPLGISAHGARTHDPRRAIMFIEFVRANRPQGVSQRTQWRATAAVLSDGKLDGLYGD